MARAPLLAARRARTRRARPDSNKSPQAVLAFASSIASTRTLAGSFSNSLANESADLAVTQQSKAGSRLRRHCVGGPILNASAFKAVLQASLTAFTSLDSTASSILLGAMKSPRRASSSAKVAAPPQQASPPNLGLSVFARASPQLGARRPRVGMGWLASGLSLRLVAGKAAC